ncbi:hypothetical protein P280DRAFT_477697 [Massarina eburnea CBS 473.64]|uniref:Uncharacterized protein n=1 Tax=Massarina eburnea CBS 473.64 TaxID=1395130 RepID=A0A6A6S9P9_9PLEO|nr:hypothetical protein P280DRAFT_477697 [Massarina eburnea CBS 473.64]
MAHSTSQPTTTQASKSTFEKADEDSSPSSSANAVKVKQPLPPPISTTAPRQFHPNVLFDHETIFARLARDGAEQEEAMDSDDGSSHKEDKGLQQEDLQQAVITNDDIDDIVAQLRGKDEVLGIAYEDVHVNLSAPEFPTPSAAQTPDRGPPQRSIGGSVPTKTSKKGKGTKRKAAEVDKGHIATPEGLDRPRKKARKTLAQKKAEKDRDEAAHVAGEGLGLENPTDDQTQDAGANEDAATSGPAAMTHAQQDEMLQRADADDARDDECFPKFKAPVTIGIPEPRPTGYDPILDTGMEIDDVLREKYVGYLVFESDPLNEGMEGYDIVAKKDELQYDAPIVGGQRKVLENGNLGKRRRDVDDKTQHLSTKPILEKFRRKSAADKLKIWRERSSKAQRADRRRPRHITLVMRAPTGPTSEPAIWAAHVKNLERLLRPGNAGMAGSFIHLKLDIPEHNHVMSGLWKPYVDALRDLYWKYPRNVGFEVDNASIEMCDPEKSFPVFDINKELDKILNGTGGSRNTYGRDVLLMRFGTSMKQIERDARDVEEARANATRSRDAFAADRHINEGTWRQATEREYSEYEEAWANMEAKAHETKKRDIQEGYESILSFLKDVRHYQRVGVIPQPPPNVSPGNEPIIIP